MSMTDEECLAIIKDKMAGQPLQYKPQGGEGWKDRSIHSPLSFNFNDFDYRRKPVPPVEGYITVYGDVYLLGTYAARVGGFYGLSSLSDARENAAQALSGQKLGRVFKVIEVLPE